MGAATGGSAAERHFWLDACRALAIALVVLSHGRHFLAPAFEPAAVLRAGGFLGVELFFVLSGFLIGRLVWHGLERGGAGGTWVRTFWSRRWLRTLPNYYLFLGVNGVLVLAGIVPGRVPDLLPYLVFVQNLAWPHPPLFGEAWSLAVEEWFYLAFPLCLLAFAPAATPRRAFLIVVALFLLLPLLATVATVYGADPPWDEGVRKIAVLRLDALMLGVLGGWLVGWRPLGTLGAPIAAAAALCTLAAVVAVFLALGNEIEYHTGARLWLLRATSLGCLLLILCGLGWSRPPRCVGACVAAGARWSYALYLAHMPVFHLSMRVLGHAEAGDWRGAWLRWCVFIGASILLAAVVERFFERPILHWRDRVAPRAPRSAEPLWQDGAARHRPPLPGRP